MSTVLLLHREGMLFKSLGTALLDAIPAKCLHTPFEKWENCHCPCEIPSKVLYPTSIKGKLMKAH